MNGRDSSVHVADSNDDLPIPIRKNTQTNTHPHLHAHAQRARIAESENDFDKALRLYDRVTRVAPGYAFAWSNKGNAFIALGDLDSGLDAYKRAIEVCIYMYMYTCVPVCDIDVRVGPVGCG